MDILTAIGLGMLTIIHPCPLSTNFAALSFLLAGGQIWKSKISHLVAFIAGEVVAFAALGMVISAGLLEIPAIANFLQNELSALIGPVLILLGMMLSGLLFPRQSTLKLGERFRAKSAMNSAAASLAMGVLLALSFCPMSAAVFFGVLVPLAISRDAAIAYPVLFGLGTSLPLVALALVLSRGVGRVYGRSFLSKWSTKKISAIAGAVLIFLGIALSLHSLFRMA
ncbi:MAG: sulfite exporter TauE/SafE family protein [Deferribacteres bacterium]|nr:sulfite exporter TauE/SafE family protein [candidate division KSB1 bacterium]MCB9511192.1 sulfite exporter TauE/SafE family protein [Deferribacteres bacterium]